MGLDPSKRNAFSTIGLDFDQFHHHVARHCAAIEAWCKEDRDFPPMRLSERFNRARAGLWYSTAGDYEYSNNLALLEMNNEYPRRSLTKLAMDGRALLHRVMDIG